MKGVMTMTWADFRWKIQCFLENSCRYYLIFVLPAATLSIIFSIIIPIAVSISPYLYSGLVILSGSVDIDSACFYSYCGASIVGAFDYLGTAITLFVILSLAFFLVELRNLSENVTCE